MVLEDQRPDQGAKTPETSEVYDVPQTDVHLSKEFVHGLQGALKADDEALVWVLLSDVHAADVADILEVLSPGQRKKLIGLIGARLDPEVLREIEGEAQDDLYEHMPNDQIADAVTDMETDDAVYVIEELDEDDRADVLRKLAADDRVAIEESLSYPEDSAGRLMQRQLFSIPEFWTVGQTIDFLRTDNDAIPEDFYDVFVVDPAHRPVGTVPLSRLMRNGRAANIGDIMDKDPYLINVQADQEEVAYKFTKYHLISASVVDDAQRLVGVITVDDIVDVIEEEAEEDILALAGVTDESGVNENFIEITRSRFAWLFVNLATAALASAVIALFGATMEQLIALAVLMPIVASMGGNAGIQTMTVAVRAIATKELSSTNAVRVMNRELLAAILNGALLAAIAGVVVYLWQGNHTLAVVFSAAMLFNVFVAGLFGLLVPMALHKMKIDPAIASTVFVTTITDVVGFFVFLGLAHLYIV
ncbi:MAG: magnesium transporter [Kordiimonadales bacterium]|nr:MAG: magnesium transporter [Kordiimonadales bacterium]